MSGPKYIRLTAELIEACESRSHSYSAKTLLALGADLHPGTLHPRVGWKAKLIGTAVTEHDYQVALDSRSKAFFREDTKKDQLSLF